MIRERRQAHFVTVIILTCVLPLVFLVGVLRQPMYGVVDPTAHTLLAYPATTSQQPPLRTTTVATAGKSYIISLFGGESGEIWLSIQSKPVIRVPDPLLYWSATPPSSQTATPSLPKEAILLGHLTTPAQIPAQIRGRDGHLILYSQGHQTILATIPLAATMTTGG